MILELKIININNFFVTYNEESNEIEELKYWMTPKIHLNYYSKVGAFYPKFSVFNSNKNNPLKFFEQRIIHLKEFESLLGNFK